jgi:hypothetical protein
MITISSEPGYDASLLSIPPFTKHELNEIFLEIQTHSMKYNLIFGGIKSEGAIENTEKVVKKFLVDELLIPF